MITKQNKLKIWILTIIDTIIFLSINLYIGTELGFWDGIEIAAIYATTYLVTEKCLRWSVWLWLGLVILPRVFYGLSGAFFQPEPLFLGAILIVMIAVFSPITRLFLQWSMPAWKQSQLLYSTVWKTWFFIEELSIIIVATTCISLINKGYSMSIVPFAIIGIRFIYGKIRKKFFLQIEIINYNQTTKLNLQDNK